MAVTGQIMAACRLAVGETRDLARELRRIVTVPISKCRDEDSIFIRKVQIDLHLNTTAETVYWLLNYTTDATYRNGRMTKLWTESKLKEQDRQCTHNLTFRRVHETTVTVEKQ
jgi:hypothetical protein